MLRETNYRIENLTKPLADLDITQTGSWVGVADFSDGEQSVYFEGSQVRLPEKMRFPIIRSLNEKTALVVDSRIQILEQEFEEYEPGKHRAVKVTFLNENNAWIITSTGAVRANFSADDAIQDVVITKDFIVVTQFDEGAIGGDGLTIFDLSGNRVFGYYDVFGEESVTIYDCYAACLIEENIIAFFAYNDFNLVLFDISAKAQKTFPTPNILHGSDAITMLGDKIYFHSPYSDKFGIYEWQIGSKETRKFGEYESYLARGLTGGRFLARTDSGYTIISLQ